MKIGFIGCGNMGGALARAAAKEGFEVLLYDKNEELASALALELGAKRAVCAQALAEVSDFLFLGVKPAIIPSVIDTVKGTLAKRDGCVLVSMAAGVAISKIEESLCAKMPVIRIMPNTPASVGEGMILVSKNELVTDETREKFFDVMRGAGKLDLIDERLIEAASAVSGCGPAFVYMFIEALADGGVKCGLPRDKALEYAAATVKGAAALALESGKNPGALKDAVCSPGGSTIEGVMALERGAFRGTVMNAVDASYEKTLKLGK